MCKLRIREAGQWHSTARNSGRGGAPGRLRFWPYVPGWLIGFFANRDLSLRGSWRLAGAALMPVALFMCAVIFLYGCGGLDLVRLTVAGALHLVMGWVYLIISPLRLPRHPAAAATVNPFA